MENYNNLIPSEMSDEEILVYLIGESNAPENFLEEIMKEWNSRCEKDGGYDATQLLLGN